MKATEQYLTVLRFEFGDKILKHLNVLCFPAVISLCQSFFQRLQYKFVLYPEATIKFKGIATAWLSKVHIN